MKAEVGDIAECVYCAIDFVVEDAQQRFCKTKACVRDRYHDRQARYVQRVQKKPGYAKLFGKDPTAITPGRWASRRSRRKDDDAG